MAISMTPESFDRRNEFLVRKSFTCNGVHYTPGMAFDKTQVTDRRLRQLFAGRSISYDFGPLQHPANEVPPSPTSLPGSVPSSVSVPGAGDGATSYEVRLISGKTYVAKGEDVVAGPMSEKEAKKLAKKMNGDGSD